MGENVFENKNMQRILISALAEAKRPIILIGEGVRTSNTIQEVKTFSQHCCIPILSSRCSEDIVSGFKYYYGYIGSHGIRYANFILSKSDLIIVLGNRMAFPKESKSFLPLLKKSRCIRIEIDKNEMEREIPNTRIFYMDLRDFWKGMDYNKIHKKKKEWIYVCDKLRDSLFYYDIDHPIREIGDWMRKIDENIPMVCDVGNNEFWISRAYIYAGIKNRILYSRAFGTLGNALPKAIGMHYVMNSPIVCFIGDQGMQMNIQELQYIAEFKIPILIFIINNESSGMIKDNERIKYGNKFVHVEKENGYRSPDFKKIATAYGIDYECGVERVYKIKGPKIVELKISKKCRLNLNVPKGNPCQDMKPLLGRTYYNYLDRM